MTRHASSRSVLAAATTIAAFALGAGSAAAQETLKFNFFPPPADVAYGKVFEPYVNAASQASKGTIKIESFPGGTLGRDPRQQLKMLADGVFDITWAIPAYTPGKFPDRGLFELPALFKDALESSATIWRMYEKGLLPGYDDFHPLAFGGVSPYGIHSAKPIKSIDDLKGMKIRAGGPIHSATIKALGAAPIGMPITSAAESLSRGVLDAAETEWFGVKAFRFYDVTQYHFELPLGSNYAVLTMDRKKFDGLPAAAKEALDSLGGAKLSRQFGTLHLNVAKAIRAGAEKDSGHHVIEPSADDLAKLASIQKAVIDEWVAKTPNGAKMLADLHSVLNEVRAGQ